MSAIVGMIIVVLMLVIVGCGYVVYMGNSGTTTAQPVNTPVTTTPPATNSPSTAPIATVPKHTYAPWPGYNVIPDTDRWVLPLSKTFADASATCDADSGCAGFLQHPADGWHGKSSATVVKSNIPGVKFWMNMGVSN